MDPKIETSQSFALPLHSPSLQPGPQAHTYHLQPQQQQQLPQNQGPVPYNADFADSLVAKVLTAPSPMQPQGSPSPVSPSPLQFPLPMESPLRQHPSHLHANLTLTHPNGTLYGGPCSIPAHSLRAHAQDIVELNGLESKQELAEYLTREIGKRGNELEIKLRERQRLKEGNERVSKRLRALEEEREIDLRQQERWRKERERKGR